MRKLITIVCFCIIPLSMLGKNRNSVRHMMLVEADCLSFINLSAELHFSHSFAEKWSAYAGGILMFGKISKGLSDIEKIHYEEFNNKPLLNEYDEYDLFMSEIAIQYWPKKAFKGHFVSIGIRYGDISKTDCLIEYGYRIPIWKGLGASISIKTGLLGLIRKDNFYQNLFNISIGYEF